MDMFEKAQLTAEIRGLKAMIAASSPNTGFLSQVNFPVAGPIVTIPTLPPMAAAIKTQSDCLERLANLLERVIATS